MTISGLQVQHILRTYHKTTRWEEGRIHTPTNRCEGNGCGEVSVEGRKRQIRQKAVNHVLERLTETEQVPFSSPEETR